MKRESFCVPKRWGREEINRLLSLKEERKSKREIAQALNRSSSSVEGKLDDLSLFGMPGEIRSHSVRRSTEPDISSDLLRERDRQLAQDTRDLTSVLLGDPIPARSALAKKMGETA